jgi:phospho-N-acetylmuramoyl-pentapeptide-transferase
MEFQIITIALPTTIAFIIGILCTPLVTYHLYKYQVWKKKGGKTALGGHEAVEFNKLKGEAEIHTPRMGGIVIWLSVLLTTIILYFATVVAPTSIFAEVFFLSRSQTLIPLAVLLVGALVGFLNDYYDVTHDGRGISIKTRLSLIAILAGVIGWWFYAKLDVTTINIPFTDPLSIGILIIPAVIFVMLGLYASGVIDGIDGLSGGVFASIFFSYSGIAFIQTQYDIAALCGTIGGAILAFLWFNIPPARFWMTETGSMSLTLTLGVIVFMTDSLAGGYGVSLLLIVGLLLVVTVLSNIIQILYRKTTGKKFFRIAPLHHHFEAIGWPSHKVTMRYWIISIVCAIAGLTLAGILSAI